MKKSDFLECTPEQFKEVAEKVQAVIEQAIKDKSNQMTTVLKTQILNVYKETKLYHLAAYLLGEVMGKVEMGVEIKDAMTTAMFMAKNEMLKRTNETDDLLRNYKPKAVN